MTEVLTKTKTGAKILFWKASVLAGIDCTLTQPRGNPEITREFLLGYVRHYSTTFLDLELF